MNHVFTCVGCSQTWDVVSDAKLDCFFSGLCCACIQAHEISKLDVERALRPLLQSQEVLDVIKKLSGEKKADNLFADPLFSITPASLERQINGNGSGAATQERIAQVQEVFEDWKARFNHPDATLDERRSKIISKQLVRYNRTPAQLKKAFYGASIDPWLQKGGYDDIGLILRDADHIERYINVAERSERETRSMVDGMEGAEDYGDILADLKKNKRYDHK